jgi:hypothetical protein
MTESKRKKPGRPKDTKRGKAERISINISQEHKEWLKANCPSYSKGIAKALDAAILADT